MSKATISGLEEMSQRSPIVVHLSSAVGVQRRYKPVLQTGIKRPDLVLQGNTLPLYLVIASCRPTDAKLLLMSTPVTETPPQSIDQLETTDLSRLLSSIEEGLPASLLAETQERLELSFQEIASFLGVSTRTLERRRENGTLSSVESERLYRIVRLFRKATDVFNSEEEARKWLKRPQMRLGEQIPLEIARLEPGARETERLLGRIEHGIPA